MHDYGLITPENLQTWVSEQKFSGTFLLTPSTIQGVPKPRYWFGEFIIISKDTFNDFAIYLFTDAEFYCCVTSGGQWSNSWLQIHPNKYYTNPNLLDNWYFSDPVNQRNGYIIPKDTVIYSDSSLSESSKIGPAAYACTVVESASTYVKVWNTKLPDNYYYAAVSAAIPGYCGNWIYTIDRWNLADGDGLLEIHDGYITYKDSIYFFQPISKDTVKSLIGKTVTLSFLYSDGTLDTGSCNITSWSGNWNVFLEIGNIRVVGVDKGLLWVSCTANGKGMIAAKLELGDTQTLAHKEGDKWVLNEIPDFREQLRRCMYYAEKIEDGNTPVITNATFIPAGATSAIFVLPYERKRTSPSIRFNDVSNYRVIVRSMSGNTTAFVISNISILEVGTIKASVLVTFSATSQDWYGFLQRADNTTGGYAFISADL